MPLGSETVTLAGSGLVFNNTYGAGVTDAYRGAVLEAEHFLQGHFVSPVTVNVSFDFQSLGDGIAENRFSVYAVSYADLVVALTAHATTADDALAVAGLPAIDPSGGRGFEISAGEAQALGLFGPTGRVDDTVTLSTTEPWTFGSDAVGALEHELTEGVFGRVQSLGLSSRFAPLDLFRFSLSGQRDFTGGQDGAITVFGVDSNHLTTFAYHNAINAAGVNDGGDLGDWEFTFSDSFGGGGGGIPSFMSTVDLRVLDVLGWTPPATPLPGFGDDFASTLGDPVSPMGQITVGVATVGNLELAGDRDWFRVQLNAGTDYVINLTGQAGGLDDPTVYLHGSSGGVLAVDDDISYPGNLDSRLIVHATTSGTFYVEAGSFGDETGGRYTVSVQAGATAATAGNDVLVGQAAGSIIMAQTGNDTITGDDAQNYLRGDEGDDSVSGGSAFDDINGNMGNDTLHGNDGNDWVVGGKDNDLQFGDAGDDVVWGNLGNDTLDGGDGADQVRGGQGDDVLTGGAGNDYISGDRGNDTESGGAGADLFHGSQDAGIDRVLDFHLSEGDRVMLDPGTTYTVTQVGADTVIDMGTPGNQMILVGVTMSTLPPGTIFLG
ncbi:NF038122 family metalloprotease [Phenylobacterium sp.]|uniref:NF038122 family metalloprotease n=1 Tax=Phenylobacterium sp. TaxID=1871053 RepID=UPI003563F89D